MKSSHHGFILFLNLMLFLALNSCGQEQFYRLQETANRNVSTTPGEDLEDGVCNPFGGSGIPKIRATLYEGKPGASRFQDFLDNNKIVSKDIYFSELDLPPTDWKSGFIGPDGKLLENSQGQPLVEWFGLEMESAIQLAPDQEEGYYIFHVLADDGFVLKLLVDGNYETSINMDYISAPAYTCGPKLFRMTKKTRLKMKATYFQGPRNFMALQLFMKRVAPLSEYTGNFVKYKVPGGECAQTNEVEILRNENFYLGSEPNC